MSKVKVLVDPRLPKNFDCTPNDERPKSHEKWVNRAYVQTVRFDNFELTDDGDFKKRWFEAWPTGARYDVRCLDGGAWDRSTSHGSFKTLDEAIELANIINEGMVELHAAALAGSCFRERPDSANSPQAATACPAAKILIAAT